MNRQLSYAPALVESSFCGEATPGMKMMQNLLNQQICLLCYDEAKSLEELAQILQTNKIYIKDSLNSLCENGMMKKESCEGKNDVYSTLFPMIHENLAEKIYKLRNDYLIQNDIPEKITSVLMSCEKEIKALDFYGNDLPIKYLNWFLYVVCCNLIQHKITSYFSDKTDEVLLGSQFYRTNKRNFSLRSLYLYADEKEEKLDFEKYWSSHSTFYNRVGFCHVNNVMDAKPFPYAWENGSFTWEGGRNKYLWNDNFSTYLKIMNGDKSGTPLENLSDEEKKVIADFINHGVVKEIDGHYKGMIPYFTKEVFSEMEKILSIKITPIAKELAQNLGSKIEEELLPSMKGVKDRINQFYIFWISEMMQPLLELWWYGMNVDGLEIPEDYSKSAAAIYILEE